MANFNGTQQTVIAAGSNPPVNFVGGRVRYISEQIVYNSQVAGSTFTLPPLPIGAVLLSIKLTTDTSTGSTTLAFGNASSAAAYVAASAYTTTDTQTLLALKTAPQQTALTAQTNILITTAAATLPSSGNLNVIIEYGVD